MTILHSGSQRVWCTVIQGMVSLEWLGVHSFESCEYNSLEMSLDWEVERRAPEKKEAGHDSQTWIQEPQTGHLKIVGNWLGQALTHENGHWWQLKAVGLWYCPSWVSACLLLRGMLYSPRGCSARSSGWQQAGLCPGLEGQGRLLLLLSSPPEPSFRHGSSSRSCLLHTPMFVPIQEWGAREQTPSVPARLPSCFHCCYWFPVCVASLCPDDFPSSWVLLASSRSPVLLRHWSLGHLISAPDSHPFPSPSSRSDWRSPEVAQLREWIPSVLVKGITGRS